MAGPAPEVDALLSAHHALMRSQSPEESCHVMTAEALRADGALLFALMDEKDETLAVGALKPLVPGSEPAALRGLGAVVELKSMHVASAHRGHGYGHLLLRNMLEQARKNGAVGACLETGSATEFAAARALYLSQGFLPCPPFGSYKLDPLSLFMSRSL